MQLRAGAYSTQPHVPRMPPGRQSSSRRHSLRSIAVDLLCFAIPLCNFFTIPFIGVLPGTEVLTLSLILPCLVSRWRRIWSGYNKTILVLMGLWLLSQMITDFYRQSPFESMAKGWAAIVFFSIDLCVATVLLHKNSRRIVIWTVGVIMSNAINTALNPPPENVAWKFGH